MTKDYPLSELERLVDGECPPEEADRIRSDIAGDPALAQNARRLDEINRVMRASARDAEAPAGLRRAVLDRYALAHHQTDGSPSPSPAAPGHRMGRRAMLIGTGGALAAGLAGFAVFPAIVGTGRQPDPVVTFFKDFETYLLKDKAIDIAEGNMVRLAGWFGDRLPFNLPPVSSSGVDAKLIGGRLCWLLGRRLASLSFESSTGPVVLYIMDGKGIALPAGKEAAGIGKKLSWHRSSDHTCLIWTSDGLMYCMVGTHEVRKMMTIAESLVG